MRLILCLFVLCFLLMDNVMGQVKMKITEVRYTDGATNVNISANSAHLGIISFVIYPDFIKSLNFSSNAGGIDTITSNSSKKEYKLYIHPNPKSQIISIKGYEVYETINVPKVDTGSYREYHINWQPLNIDSIVQVKTQYFEDSIKNEYQAKYHISQSPLSIDSIVQVRTQQYGDSIRKAYQPLIGKQRKPLIQDWTKDFKIIVGLSNGIVAGEIFGFYGELKFGEKTGFALEGGYCPGFNEIYDERWSVGMKGYYKCWFLSGLYGTTMAVGNKNTSFTMKDDGTFILEGSRTAHRKGVTLLGGYDRTFGWLHFTAGIGTTLTTSVKPEFLPAWNIGIGVSITDLMLKLK